jgi:arabinogalactan endo-1,4-beta-galactosidase
MNVNEIFPSNYLKASDLKGAQPRVTIATVVMETLGQGADAQQRPVIYFEGKEKGLVANKTNMNAIATVFGDETDDWPGAEIVLFETMVDYQGKTTPAIRIKIPPRKPVRQLQTVQSGQQEGPPPAPPIDDDAITF